MSPDEIINRYPLISDQIDKHEIRVLLNYLTLSIIDNEASVVEMGCYAGTTSLMIQRYLKYNDLENEFHVYDSFEGLPEKTAQDQSPAGMSFKKGELKYTKKAFINNFKKCNLQTPNIHKGWFSELSKDDIPSQIAFAFLDGDYYQSIKQSLSLIDGCLTEKSFILIDDYQSEQLPGAKKATDEWLKNNSNFKLIKVENSVAIIGGDKVNY